LGIGHDDKLWLGIDEKALRQQANAEFNARHECNCYGKQKQRGEQGIVIQVAKKKCDGEGRREQQSHISSGHDVLFRSNWR